MSAAAMERFPDAFRGLRALAAPPRVWGRRRLTEFLTRFEILRGTSPSRTDIARFITNHVQREFVLASISGTVPLEEAFDQRVRAIDIEQFPSAREVPAAAAPVAGDQSGNRGIDELHRQLERLKTREGVTEEALLALQQTLSRLGSTSQRFDLRGQKFVLLGGTAELSPLSLLLRAGADVLTTHSSSDALARRLRADVATEFEGRLFATVGGVDLLQKPVEFSCTVVEFAGGRPVHIVALAYKGGGGREWRLAAAMDGIVRTVRAQGLLASVAYYRSPSIVTQVTASTAAVSRARLDTNRSIGTEAVRALTLDTLFRPNIVEHSGTNWTRGFVPEQGASYAPANLFGKTYAAEVHHADAGRSSDGGWRVSANVAPITQTASTDTDATRWLFPRLGRLGIDVIPAPLSQQLMYLLLMSDLFGHADAEPPLPFAKQIHGGVFTNPWALNSVLKQALLRGISPMPSGSRDTANL